MFFTLISPRKNEKYVFLDCSISFLAVRFLFGFNFICCRLKNCLVYQNCWAYFVWVAKQQWKRKKRKKKKKSMKSEKFRAIYFAIGNRWCLLESSARRRRKKWWRKIKRTMKLKCLYLLRQYLSSFFFPRRSMSLRSMGLACLPLCKVSRSRLCDSSFARCRTFNGQMSFKNAGESSQIIRPWEEADVKWRQLCGESQVRRLSRSS